MGEDWVLKNRYLIIDPPDEYKIQPRLANPSSTQKIIGSTQKNNESTQKSTQEMILEEIRLHPFCTRESLAKKIGITPDGIKKQLDKLKKAGKIQHCGSDRKGHWEIIE